MIANLAIERPAVRQIWRWLGDVPDPEIPVVSVVDLGIVRDVTWNDAGELQIAVTPTYSGCPATDVIAADIKRALHAHGVDRLRVETRIAPPWTTDWISAAGREKLHAFGIAPPAPRGPAACPRCGATTVHRLSEFGSTPCKALYRCDACLEPFDYFKCL